MGTRMDEIDTGQRMERAGWIEHSDAIAETADSNRFGNISDVCVTPDHRGQRIASRLLCAIEEGQVAHLFAYR